MLESSARRCSHPAVYRPRGPTADSEPPDDRTESKRLRHGQFQRRHRPGKAQMQMQRAGKRADRPAQGHIPVIARRRRAADQYIAASGNMHRRPHHGTFFRYRQFPLPRAAASACRLKSMSDTTRAALTVRTPSPGFHRFGALTHGQAIHSIAKPPCPRPSMMVGKPPPLANSPIRVRGLRASTR